MDHSEIQRTLTSDALLQRLATAEHERWAHWQRYLHDHGQRQPDGSLILPGELVRQWDTQIATAYEDLSPEEQNSDQEQVQRYLPILIEALTSTSVAEPQ